MEELRSIIYEPDWKSILKELVRKERLDPEKIDIARLADLYLEELRKMREINLGISGTAVLVCAILLAFKARAVLEKLVPLQEESTEQAEIEEYGEYEEVEIVEIPELGEEVAVLVPPKPVAGILTLEDLIEAVEEVLRLERRKKRKRRTRRERERIETFNRIEEEEDFQKRIEELLERLIRGGKREYTLSEICHGSPVDVILPLLHLAHNGKVLLYQEEPFGEIRVILNEESAS